MDKFRKHLRWQKHNYSWNGYYFVTICTHNREHLFSTIQQETVHLQPIGEIVEECWYNIPELYPYAKLDEYVIMPNHFHGIIIIDHPHSGCGRASAATVGDETVNRGFQPEPESLSIVIRNFKSAVTMKSRQQSLADRVWQSRFHDRVVRNEDELNRIRDYIQQNPARWHKST